MNSSDQKTFDFSRAESLLQRLFEEKLDVAEAEELTACVDAHPEFAEFVRKNFEVDYALRFFGDLENRPIDFDSETLRSLFDIDRDAFSFQASRSPFVSSAPAPYLDLDLDQLVQLAAESPTLPALPDIKLKRPEISKPLPQPRPLDRELRDPNRIGRLLWILIPCLLLLGVYIEFRPHSLKPSTEVVEPAFLAEVVSAIDVRVAPEDPPIKQGLRLEKDRLRFESGTVELAVSNGVRLVLEGPVDFKLNSTMQTLCVLGRLSVFVPPEGKGFEVATPQLNIRDLGTEFFVDVKEKESKLHVVKGEVETNWFNSDWIPVSAGQAIRIDAGAVKPTRFIAEPQAFVDQREVRRRQTDYQERRQTVRQREKRRLAEDQDRLFSLDAATVHGCQRIAGLDPGDEVLRFQSVRDHAEMSIPGGHRNLTLVAVARIDAMKHYGALLCLGDDFPNDPGQFVWQLERTGELLFHVRDVRNVRYFNSPPVIKPGDWKTWMHLAVAVDADRREVRHYVDGRLAAVLPWTDPIPLRMPSGTLGNDRPETHKKTVRIWNGDIARFDAFSRALSDEEVAEIYDGTH